MNPGRIAVLITCHNRKEKTLACLQALFQASRPGDVALEVHLVDDGSTDGTGPAVVAAFPSVKVLAGDGALFWGGGMRMAFASALATAPDAYLWLNDDTLLDPEGLLRMLQLWERIRTHSKACIVVGAVRDPASGQRTYGGVRLRWRWGRPRFAWNELDEAVALPCDTMNGNCVLVSSAAAERTGELDSRFVHAMGDFDYGLRARKAGIPILQGPGSVGICARNTPAGTWRDPSRPLAERWRKLIGTKGLPPRVWWVFCFRHLGWYAPFAFLSPFVRLVLDSFAGTEGEAV